MVKIVTDSTSDLPPEIARELGITVIPAYVHFGNQSYRDGVDITPKQIYQKMANEPVHPTTSTPAPGDFADAYKKLSAETSEIVCITVTSRHSGVYEAAMTGKQAFCGKSRVEVIDSLSVTMGLGLIAILAARKARDGKSIDEVMKAIYSAIPRTHGKALLNTAKYAMRGGRLGKVGGVLGSLVKVKPFLEIENGRIHLSGGIRTRSGGIEQLYKYVKDRLPIEEAAVVHSNAVQEAESLAKRIRSISQQHTIVAELGSSLGVHAGPEALVLVLRSK